MKFYAVLTVLTVLIFGCSKSDEQRNEQIDVDNTWRCEIGGKLYQGSIDTSYTYISPHSGVFGRDTVVYLSGSTADGKANIAIKMRIDRMANPNGVVQIGQGGYLTFDTASINFLDTWVGTHLIPFKIEAFTGKKLKGTFTGNLHPNGGPVESLTNGSISLEIGKGKNAPKFFDVTIDGNRVVGPLRSAVFLANTLIMDGFSFNGDSTYQLAVHTGASIKPGTYKSSDGDVGFYMWRPSIVTHTVLDTTGNLSVTIQSVEGNIVTGTFTGTATRAVVGGQTVPMEGKFRCRVKEYVPGTDGANQWKFTMSSSSGFPNPFFAAGGSVTDAAMRQTGGRYVLTLNGTSDGDRSIFRLTMASFQLFAVGTYELSSRTDTCYLQTPVVKYTSGRSGFYVRIDSLSSTRIVGGFYGSLGAERTVLGYPWGGTVRKASFRADGQL